MERHQPGSWSRLLALLLLASGSGCQDCGDRTNGAPFTFHETDTGLDVAIAPDSHVPDAADFSTSTRDVAVCDVSFNDADMQPPITCSLPLPSEPPMQNGEVRKNFVCDDGALLNFEPFFDEQGCHGEPTHYNGFVGSAYSPGFMFAAEDGCSVCVCGFDNELECVSACQMATCEVDGEVLAAGETFLSTDGRQICACLGDGEVECSTIELDGQVGCVVDGERLATGEPAPTVPDECGPCWCEFRGSIACIEYPNCDGCYSLGDDSRHSFGSTVTTEECGACTCAADHLWSCEQDCEMSATCDVGVTAVPNWTFWEYGANRYDCYGGGIGSTSVGAKICVELNRGRAAHPGEIVYAADGCRACVCGGFNDPMACVDTCTPSCSLGDRTFGAGEVFRADDGCNACICGGDGNIYCTEQTCPAVRCEGGKLPGETWFVDVDDGLPALCRCLADGQVDCTTERFCSPDGASGVCLPDEKCRDYRCRM